MILNYWFLENSIFSSYFVPLYIGLVFEIWASSLILLIPFRRKSFWGLRIAANSLAMIGIAIGLGYLRNVASDSLALRIGCSLIIYSSLLGALFLTFDEKPIDIFLVWVSILAIREAADGEDTLIKLIFQVPLRTMGYIEGGGFFVNGLIFDAVHLFVQLPLGFIFSKYASRTNDKTIIMRTAVLSVSIVFTCIIIKAVVVSYSSESIALYGAAVALTYLLSLLCLILRTDVLTGSQKTREIETMNAVLDAQQKQFEDSKQSIALINAKVHDIKHRIDDFGDKVAADTLNQLKSSIEIYDRPFNTGSQVLDTILYSKSLECEAAGIKLTVIGNGAPLHFIPSSKRFYLFSNIIDNAIEATHDIKNEEKKIVGLALRQEGDNFLIEEYNYFEGERKIQGQDYQTTKRDTKQKHGLGIKSIRAFAEEYGGKVEISIKRDMFFITVTIPLKEKGPKALMDHAK